jgi:hypothetical protein
MENHIEIAKEDIQQIEYAFRSNLSVPRPPHRVVTQRVWEKKAGGGSDLLWDDNDPYIYVLVTGKARFTHPAEVEAQPYALAVTFSYVSEADIQLRQKISEQVKIKQREQVRVRTQVQV